MYRFKYHMPPILPEIISSTQLNTYILSRVQPLKTCLTIVKLTRNLLVHNYNFYCRFHTPRFSPRGEREAGKKSINSYTSADGQGTSRVLIAHVFPSNPVFCLCHFCLSSFHWRGFP